MQFLGRLPGTHVPGFLFPAGLGVEAISETVLFPKRLGTDLVRAKGIHHGAPFDCAQGRLRVRAGSQGPDRNFPKAPGRTADVLQVSQKMAAGGFAA